MDIKRRWALVSGVLDRQPHIIICRSSSPSKLTASLSKGGIGNRVTQRRGNVLGGLMFE